MKKFLLPLLIIFFSCSRQDMSRPSNDEPEISYDIDGKHYAHIGEQTAINGSIGVFATKLTGTPGVLNTFYSFAGFTDNSSLIQIIITTPNDTLKTILYHGVKGSGSQIRANNEVYALFENNDYLDITITDYRDGMVNGIFAGNLTKILSVNPNVTQPATVTNGLIKNVKIRY